MGSLSYLTDSNIQDIATYLFYLPQACPAAAPSTSATPSSWDFGSITNGTTSASKSFTIMNSGTAATGTLTFPASSTMWPSSKTCGSTIAAGGSCTVNIAYKPAAAGANDSFTYTVTGTGGFSISLTGNSPSAATPANLSVSPTSAAFGSVTVGNSSATQSFTVSNTGTIGATGVAFTGTNNTEFVVSGNTCIATLAGGGTCTFNVRYTPTAAGADSATLSIAYTSGTTVNISMTGTGAAAPVASLQASPVALAFGTATMGSTSATQTVSISNTGGATATTFALANGDATHFVVSANTCGTTLAAGASCSLAVAYKPNAVGLNNAALTFSYAGGTNVTVQLSGTGTAAPTANLATSPTGATFGNVTVGQSSPALAVTLTNSGGAAATGVSFNNSNGAEFAVGSSSCGATVNAGASCNFNITYTPSAAGADSATLTIGSSGGAAVVMSLTGIGVSTAPPPPPPPPPPTTTVDLIEYFHAAFGHYFITYLPGEISKLDDGTFVGWARTGRQFKAWTAQTSGDQVPVCRFFTTFFAPKSSHFYTPNAPECTGLKPSTVWGYEGEVFYTQYPSFTGVCPPNTVPVYRMYNNGMSGAPNHRYTTDFSVREQMLAQGWIPEGAGTIGVIMCSPP